MKYESPVNFIGGEQFAVTYGIDPNIEQLEQALGWFHEACLGLYFFQKFFNREHTGVVLSDEVRF